MRQLGNALLIAVVGSLAWLAYQGHAPGVQAPAPAAAPAPVVVPPVVVPGPAPAPPAPYAPDEHRRRPHLPWREHDGDPFADPPGRPVVGGPVSPDGKVEITCDLPNDQKKKNVGGSDGAGLCVFTSIEYDARYQFERPLFELQAYMRKRPGGGYPQKVDSVLKAFSPTTKYGQHTGGDESVLTAILSTGRGAGVTYNGHDPHYSGSIAHMVWLVCYDRKTNWAAISDNNFPQEFVWMSCDEFLKRWKGSGGGWAFFLLSPPPPPAPTNWKVPR